MLAKIKDSTRVINKKERAKWKQTDRKKDLTKFWMQQKADWKSEGSGQTDRSGSKLGAL